MLYAKKDKKKSEREDKQFINPQNASIITTSHQKGSPPLGRSLDPKGRLLSKGRKIG